MALKKKTQKKRKDKKQVAWNKGRRMQKTDRQHLYVRREDIQLWFAILLYCGGPVYAFAIWVALVSSRRISEALTLRRQSILLNGGSHDDKPHLLFEQEPTDTKKEALANWDLNMWQHASVKMLSAHFAQWNGTA